jgi:hypothetical protein
MTIILAKFTLEEYQGPEHSDSIRESANWFRATLGEQTKVINDTFTAQ